MQHTEDNLDYIDAIQELGYTTESAFIELRKFHSLRDINLLNTKIDTSNIQGVGVFAIRDIPNETIIDKALDGHFTTQVGRYVNHARCPNAKMRYFGKDLYLVSTTDIKINTEVAINYRTLKDLYANRITK